MLTYIQRSVFNNNITFVIFTIKTLKWMVSEIHRLQVVFLLNILFYNHSKCETNFLTALERIQNVVRNDLSNDKDFYFCYRNIPSERQLRD